MAHVSCGFCCHCPDVHFFYKKIISTAPCGSQLRFLQSYKEGNSRVQQMIMGAGKTTAPRQIYPNHNSKAWDVPLEGGNIG